MKSPKASFPPLLEPDPLPQETLEEEYGYLGPGTLCDFSSLHLLGTNAFKFLSLQNSCYYLYKMMPTITHSPSTLPFRGV